MPAEVGIYLNAEAVSALFPEGTEARIELQKNVLNLLAAQYVKNPEVLKPHFEQVKNLLQPFIWQAMQACGVERMSNSTFRVTDEAVQRINAQIGISLSDHIANYALRHMERMLNDEQMSFMLQRIVENKMEEFVDGLIRQLKAAKAAATKGA